MSGRLSVVGTGPAGAAWLSPETAELIEQATDLVGYGPYIQRVEGAGHICHSSDNREELQRAAFALDLAAQGKHVAVVSGGDPGIFAMAAAVCECVADAVDDRWSSVQLGIYPGISALQAAAARVGAPLGHDFCVMSLSDVLKPWELICRRVALAAEADFAMAFYNPRSSHRPWQLGEVLALLAQTLAPDTPVVFARAVGRDDERIHFTCLAEADPERVDMSTLVLIGNSRSRYFDHGDRRWMYSPRDYPQALSGDGAANK